MGCLVHYFLLSFVFVSVDLLQPMLLKQNFTIESDQTIIENFKNSFVIGCDIIVKILLAPVFGYLTDRVGRKRVNLVGVLILTVAISAMPFCTQYYQYVLVRVAYAFGAIAISVVPLLADYVHNNSKGTCSAVLVLMSSLGALFSAELNVTLLKNIDVNEKIKVQYLAAAGVTFVVGLLYTLICLKPGNTYYLSNKIGRPERTFKKMWKVGKESLKIPEIALGYMSAFLARADSILLSLYLVLWTYSFNHNKDQWEPSSIRASMLSGVAYSVIMLSCIVYGLLFQRGKNIKWMIITMLGLAAAGTLSINLVTKSDSYLLYFSLVLLGLGMSGLLTSSLYLVNTFSVPEHRGYITGLQTLVGIFGISIQTFIGAVLMEFTNRNGPFNLFGGVCLLFIPLTFYLYRRRQQPQLR